MVGEEGGEERDGQPKRILELVAIEVGLEGRGQANCTALGRDEEEKKRAEDEEGRRTSMSCEPLSLGQPWERR